MAKLSVVTPINNEEKVLPYSLTFVFKLNPDEVILIFDLSSEVAVEPVQQREFRHSYTNQPIEKTWKQIANCLDASYEERVIK